MTRKFVIRRGAEVKGSMTISPKDETVGGVTAKVYWKNGEGFIMHAEGTTVPADGQAGFVKGCIFVDTDVVAGTSGLYVNVGTTSAANFDLVTDA